MILTDSLGLPRDKPEVVSYDDTWPTLLQKNHDIVMHKVAIGGATSTDLFRQVTYHTPFGPDVAVIQVGIVDCVPRFATQLEIQILRTIPYFGSRLLKLLNRSSVRKFRKISYVSPKAFKSNMLALKNRLNNCKIACIGIMPITQPYEAMLSGATAKRQQYNQILIEIFKDGFINVDHFTADTLMSDHHHLTTLGHKMVYDAVASKVFSR